MDIIKIKIPEAPRVLGAKGEIIIPPNKWIKLDGEYVLASEYVSTRSGGWGYSIAKGEGKSLGEYRGMFTGVVKDPEIKWYNRYYQNFDNDLPKPYEDEFEYFKQRYGKELVYFQEPSPLTPKAKGTVGYVVLGNTYRLTAEKKALVDFVKNEEKDYKPLFIQGHLLVYPCVQKVEPEDYLIRKSLFNHHVLGGEIRAVYRKNDTAYALLHMLGNGYIVSPDHLIKPIRLKEGWYILKHPFPVDNNID